MDYARFQRAGHRVTGDRSQRSRSWMQDGTRVGYDFAHAFVDDHSRLAYVEQESSCACGVEGHDPGTPSCHTAMASARRAHGHEKPQISRVRTFAAMRGNLPQALAKASESAPMFPIAGWVSRPGAACLQPEYPISLLR
jgi:hypothetical protein